MFMKTEKQTKTKQKKLQTKTINVYGMTCKACQDKIELTLLKINEVKNVSANPKKNEVKIEYEGNLNIKEVNEKLKNLGYTTKKTNATKQGLLYGLIPHAGCIFFIIASIIGATFFMNLFKPLLMNAYFFYALIAISLVFATISAIIYLRNNKLLNVQGIKRQKKYLVTLYSTTIIINLILFLLIFPLTANFASARSSTANEFSKTLELEVIIPCSGHASLIINELNQEQGVQETKYTFPYKFMIKYDEDLTNPEQILEAEIFKEFPGTIKN